MTTEYSFNFSYDELTTADVFTFINAIGVDMYEDILRTYNTESFDIALLKNILEDLKEGSYGWDDSGKDWVKYSIVSAFHYSDEMKKRYKFVIIDEKISDEGSDEYIYYSYVSADKAVDTATKKIKKQIEVLKRYGKKVTFAVE